MIISLVFLVMIVGLIIYMVAKDPKVIEIGRIMFWTGLLAILLSFIDTTLSLGLFTLAVLFNFSHTSNIFINKFYGQFFTSFKTRLAYLFIRIGCDYCPHFEL